MQVFATSPAAVYTGVGNAFTRISSTEGMRALWRGVSSVIMGAGPAHAVHFGAYELVKEFAGGNVEGASNQWIATCTYLAFLSAQPRYPDDWLCISYAYALTKCAQTDRNARRDVYEIQHWQEHRPRSRATRS